MKRITATALCLSVGIACAGLSGPAFARRDEAARAAAMQQRQAVEAQRDAFAAQRQAAEAQRRAAGDWQRAQARQWEHGQRHAFEGRPEGGGGGLNAWQACAMFFGRC